MNRFDFYPGDYLRDTIDLKPEEDGIYIRLLLYYYSNERPIQDSRAYSVARATTDKENEITQSVLSRFFVRGENNNCVIWRHERADAEITKWVLLRKRAQQNGKKGGRPPGRKTKTEPTVKPKHKPRHNPEQKLPSPSHYTIDPSLRSGSVPTITTAAGDKEDSSSLSRTNVFTGDNLQTSFIEVDQTSPPIVPPRKISASASDHDRSISQEAVRRHDSGSNQPCQFDMFWEAYPRKVGKKAARRAWDKAKDRPPIEKVLEAIERHKNSEQWVRENGQFIPHPTTWLNQGRWSDEHVSIELSDDERDRAERFNNIFNACFPAFQSYNTTDVARRFRNRIATDPLMPVWRLYLLPILAKAQRKDEQVNGFSNLMLLRGGPDQPEKYNWVEALFARAGVTTISSQLADIAEQYSTDEDHLKDRLKQIGCTVYGPSPDE
jgi:uncharacterized protein YdaU (DUF1376 family)